MAFDVNAFRAKLAAQKAVPSTQAEEKKEEVAQQQETKPVAPATLSLAERLAAAKNNKPTVS